MLAVTAALAWLAAVGGVASAENKDFAKGKKQLEAMEERAALASFDRALKHATTAAEQAEIHVHRGIALFNLLKPAEGRAAFRKALKLDAKVALPKLTSPKIRQEFKAVRQQVGAAGAGTTKTGGAGTTKTGGAGTTKTGGAGTKKSGGAGSGSGAGSGGTGAGGSGTGGSGSGASGSGTGGTGGTGGSGSGGTQTEQGGALLTDTSTPINWGGWISAGAAVAATGLAITFGVLANSNASDAADLDLISSAAEEKHSRAKSFALATNVMIGVAAAAGVASALMFIFKRRGASASAKAHGATSVVAAPAIFRGGAGLSISGALPSLR